MEKILSIPLLEYLPGLDMSYQQQPSSYYPNGNSSFYQNPENYENTNYYVQENKDFQNNNNTYKYAYSNDQPKQSWISAFGTGELPGEAPLLTGNKII